MEQFTREDKKPVLLLSEHLGKRNYRAGFSPKLLPKREAAWRRQGCCEDKALQDSSELGWMQGEGDTLLAHQVGNPT